MSNALYGMVKFGMVKFGMASLNTELVFLLSLPRSDGLQMQDEHHKYNGEAS